jgi:putative hydrolase of the HAD superfamily
MPGYRAVLFDFFGTLTRSVRRGPQHVIVARILGCELDAMVKVLDRSFYGRASGRLGSAEQQLRWVAERAGGQPDGDDLRAATHTRLWAMKKDTELRPEAVPTLTALRRAGLRTGVVSDCTHELPLLIRRLPVAPLLDAQVFSVEVGACKPDPAIYQEACRRLGVRPDECLFVGDGGSRELTGADAVGMTAVRLAAHDLAGHLTFASDQDWTGPTVTSLLDVPRLVARAPVLV